MIQSRGMISDLKLKLWDVFPSLLSGSQRQHTGRRTMPETSVFSGMALDIAMGTKLSEAMDDALSLIQTQIRHTLDADVFLLLPESLNPEPLGNQLKLYHSPAISPSTKWIDQLLNDPSMPLHYQNIHIEALQIATNEQTGWLLLSFSGNKPSQALIHQHTSLFKDELSRGISAWQTQQKTLESAITEERKVHAAELHDSMAQVLAYMRMRTAKLSSMCDETQHQDLKPIAEDLSVQAHGAYRHARELIATSRLSMEGCSLKQALSKAVNEFESRSAILFELDNRSNCGNDMCSADDIQILFIVREALSNIVRHSRATHARVVLLNDREKNLIIRVEDNGKGISHKQARSDSFGLKIMQERAQRLNAELHISPREIHGTDAEAQGTTIKLTIPKRVNP